MLGVALAIAITGWVQFYRAKTNIQPHKPSSHLMIVLLAPVSKFLLFDRYIIARGEAYLERAYGEVYVDFKRSVPRWL